MDDTNQGPTAEQAALDDFVPAWNQGSNPELYELENHAIDPDGVLWDHLLALAPWHGSHLLDLGCGSGFWLPRYAELAVDVTGVEPDPALVVQARERPGGARVLQGSAEHLALPDASVDVVHARFAYFFPTPTHDCDPGLREVRRVLRPGGALVVIDNDQHDGDFATVLAAGNVAAHQGSEDAIRSWWRDRGATTTRVMSGWSFRTRRDLEGVLRMEFPHGAAESWLADHPDVTTLSSGYLVHHLRVPA